MKISTSSANQPQVPFTSLAPFLLIAFGLAWGILALFILLPEPAVLVVWLNGKALFARADAVTDVIPPAAKIDPTNKGEFNR